MIRKHGNKHHVYKRGDNGQPVGEPLGKHRTRGQAVDQLRALYANEGQQAKKQGAGKPTSSEDYAVVPDPDKPSTWKMPIHDRKHLGLAIAALGSDASAPHGHAADLSPEDRKQALSRIHTRIGRLAKDENDKADLHAKLAKHGKKSFFGGGWTPLNQPAMPSAASWDGDDDDGDDYVGSILTPKLDQDDVRVAYDPLGGDKTNACANCAFFDADDSACRLVCGDIVAPGLCNLWLRELDDDEEDEQDATPVKIVDNKELDRPGLLETVKTAIKQVLGLSDPASGFTSGFKAFGPDNQYWAAFFTNNAQDRDGEWFSEKAHDKAIARLDSGAIPMPKLDYWHTKAYHGEAFWVGRVGHVVMAVGEFWPDEFSQAMKEYYVNSAPDDDLVSFGYFYPRSARVEHVYHDYAPFEISPLPSEVASNEWTGFASLEEFKEMTTDAQKRKELERRLGPALAKQLLATAGAKSRALDQIETSFKELDTEESDLATDVKALKEAVLILAGKKIKSNPGQEAETGRMGQPTDEEEMNDPEEEPETDEDEDEYFGRLKSQNGKLIKQVRSLQRQLKAAKADPGDGEDDGDGEDGEDDGEDDSPPAKKSRRNPQRGLKELATGYKAITDALGQVTSALVAINQKQTGLEAGINQMAKEIYNPTPASRSPYSVVPPDDPALAALAAKMQGGGNPMAPPGQTEQIAAGDFAKLVGLDFATSFGGNGKH